MMLGSLNNGSIQCPSAMEDNDDAVVFGVVGGTAGRPQVAYLTTSQQRALDERHLAPASAGSLAGGTVNLPIRSRDHRPGHIDTTVGKSYLAKTRKVG
jgi:hypothetical protein